MLLFAEMASVAIRHSWIQELQNQPSAPTGGEMGNPDLTYYFIPFICVCVCVSVPKDVLKYFA